MPKKNGDKGGKPTERKNLPVNLRIAVLTEAGYRCAVPACRTILALDLHHIWEVSEGGNDNLSNLIALCPNCHGLYHRGTIRQESIHAWKGLLVALNAAFDRDSVDLLMFLDAMTDELLVSLDGLLRFARLVSARLVLIEKNLSWVSGTPPSYKVYLSERGLLLVEAWKAGDREAVRRALATPEASTTGDMGAGLAAEGM